MLYSGCPLPARMRKGYIMNVFQTAKQVSCSEVARRLGLKERRNRWCCPFHDDEHPSMACYENTRRFYCFGCNTGGDAVDLWAKVRGTSLKEAAEQVCRDFGLMYDTESRQEVGKRKRTEEVALLPQAVWQDWRRCMLSILEEEINACTRLMETYHDPEGWIWDYALERAVRLQDEFSRLEAVEAKDLAAEVAHWRESKKVRTDVPKADGQLMERILSDRLRSAKTRLGPEERDYVFRTLGIDLKATVL